MTTPTDPEESVSTPAGIPSAIESHMGYWLRFVSNHVSQAFQRKVEAHGVTVAEWVLLRMLWAPKQLKPSVLAEQMGLTRGAISKLTERLVVKGLVATEADLADRRSQTLRLTDKGTALVPQLAALADQNDAAVFSCLSTAEQEALLGILKKLVQHHQLKQIPTD